MQPWTDCKEWKPGTVFRHHYAPRSYVVQAEDGRKYRPNRQHLRVCPASGYGSLDAGPSLANKADQAVTQDKESPTDEPEQPAGLVVLPDSVPFKEQQPEPPKENSADQYVTRSGR